MINSGEIIKIGETIPEIEEEIKKYIEAHEDIGIMFDEKMKKETRDKFYTRSADPNNSVVVGSGGMTVNELRNQTRVVEDKQSFDAGKSSIDTPSV